MSIGYGEMTVKIMHRRGPMVTNDTQAHTKMCVLIQLLSVLTIFDWAEENLVESRMTPTHLTAKHSVRIERAGRSALA